jgi:hypothetical protein
MDMDVLLITGLILLLVFAGIGYTVWAEKKRTEGLALAASQLGLEFIKDGAQSGLLERLSDFMLMQQGRGRKFQNLISGDTDEIRISIFDYQYTTGSGKQQQTHKQTIICLESGMLAIPAFTLRPENFFDKIGGALGIQKDINFEEFPNFSKMFLLKSANEPAVRALFHRELVEKLEKSRRQSMETAPGKVILYVSGQRKSPEQLKELFAEALEYFSLLTQAPGRSHAS